jgi:ParE toxin of type II toxin-antitoxin system, parDE
MRELPHIHWMPRVSRDIKNCLSFVARQPLGKPSDREADIYLAIERARTRPKSNPVSARRLSPEIELRRCKAAQFVVVYAYLPPSRRFPEGVVTIRAVRHSRVKDVFAGVKEPNQGYRGRPSAFWVQVTSETGAELWNRQYPTN